MSRFGFDSSTASIVVTTPVWMINFSFFLVVQKKNWLLLSWPGVVVFSLFSTRTGRYIYIIMTRAAFYFSYFDLLLVAIICNNRVSLSIFYTCWEMVVIFSRGFFKKPIRPSYLSMAFSIWFFVYICFFFLFNWILYWMRKYAIRSPSNTTIV